MHRAFATRQHVSCSEWREICIPLVKGFDDPVQEFRHLISTAGRTNDSRHAQHEVTALGASNQIIEIITQAGNIRGQASAIVLVTADAKLKKPEFRTHLRNCRRRQQSKYGTSDNGAK